MTSKNAKNVIQLRQLLAEKFPGVRLEAGRPEIQVERWVTEIPQLDFHLGGGFAKRGVTEIISPGVRSGGSLSITQMVRQASRNGEWIALIDGLDTFDPSALENEELSRLLWVRCSNAKEAMKAADLLLHDGTIPVVVIDLMACPRIQLRRVPSSTWHRIARSVEKSSSVCVIFTPEPMVSTAELRVSLQPTFNLEDIDEQRDTLLSRISATPSTSMAIVETEKRSGAAG